MNYPVEVTETDVLIIGGGLAGDRAAIEAYENKAKVTMIMKTKFGLGGSSAPPYWFGGMAVPFGDTDPQDSPDEYLKDIMLYEAGMADEKLARIMAYESIDRFKELEGWGMVSSQKVGGKYRQYAADSHNRPRGISVGDASPSGFVVLQDQVKKRNIPIIDDVMTVGLLTRNGECVGALSVGRDGRFRVFKAKSTILATGGANAIYPPQYYVGATGDGYAMAFHAGVELCNMEYVQVMMKGMEGGGRLLLMMPDIYNRLGEFFMPRYLPKGVTMEQCFTQRQVNRPFTARDISRYWDIAVYKEIVEGRGPVYCDFGRFSPEEAVKEVERVKRHDEEIRAKRSQVKVPVLDKPLECYPYLQSFLGGSKINERTETSLPGLFAAGEASGGVHGADRMGGAMVGATQVFGFRAGKFAAERAKDVGGVTVDQDQVNEGCQRASGIINSKGSVRVPSMEVRIRDLMWRTCLTVRNKKGLESCIKELKRLRHEELPRLSIASTAEVFRALAIPNMLDTGEMTAYAALQRKESRGTHYREDYPDMDDKNWRKRITISNKTLNLG